MKLAVGAVTETVTVNSEPPLINTRSSEISQTFKVDDPKGLTGAKAAGRERAVAQRAEPAASGVRRSAGPDGRAARGHVASLREAAGHRRADTGQLQVPAIKGSVPFFANQTPRALVQQAMKHAWRALVRRPIFTLVVVLTIGSGIGVTTALFSIVDNVLIRPLPFPDGDQLVGLNEANPAQRERAALVAPVRVNDWSRLSRTFEAISGTYSENVTDTSGSEPERLAGRRVLPRYFDVFGMTPLAGRTFVPDEERFGGPTAVVISEGLWTRRFGRSPNTVGQRLTIAGRGYPIVGIMPRAFTSATIDVWVPAQLSPQLLTIRDARFLSGVGRMKSGVTLEQARSDLGRVQHALGEQYPQTDKDWGVQVNDLKEARTGDYRTGLLLLFGAVTLLLLIAIANVAGLMLVQLRRRAGEFAIRSAIGASHRQVVAAVMREVAILCVAGAVLGAALATWLTQVMVAGFASIPRMSEVGVDTRALLFVGVVSLTAAALFGFVPVVQITGARLAPLLSAEGRGVLGGRHGLQRTLVVAQIALSVLLAGAAGLLRAQL